MTCAYCSEGVCYEEHVIKPCYLRWPDQEKCTILLKCESCGKPVSMFLPDNGDPDGETCFSCGCWLCRDCYTDNGGVEGKCPICGGNLN